MSHSENAEKHGHSHLEELCQNIKQMAEDGESEFNFSTDCTITQSNMV
jgi:hypothetical protein